MFTHLLLLVSTLSVQGVLGVANVAVRDSVSAWQGVSERRLSAAKRSDKLGRRTLKDCLRHDHELHYLDGK
jgi:hypothetical protein